MAKTDNYLFGKDGNFYRRVPAPLGTQQCRNCQLPKEYCSRVKCVNKGMRFFWIQDEEMLKKFIESLTPEDLENLPDQIAHCVK